MKGKHGGFLKVYTESLKEWMGWEALGTNYSFSVVDAWEGFDLKIEFVPEINRFRRGIRLKKVGQANRGWRQQWVGEGWRLWLFGRYTWVCGRRVSGEGGFRQLEDGSGGGGGVPAPVSTRAGPLREQRREGGVPACARTRDGFVHARGHWRVHPHPPSSWGQDLARGQGGEGRQDFSTPLRCARNDMCEVGKEDGDGFPPRREQRRERWVPACGDLCITTETHSDSGVGRLLP